MTFIWTSYAVQAHDWILVQGASGGVGVWLCRLLRSIGARVIGTASTGSKLSIAKEHGAEFALNYNEKNIVEEVIKLTEGKGVAAVFDSIGAATFGASMQSLAQNGTMVSIGNTSGSIPPFNITELSKKNLKLMKPSVFGYISTEQEFARACEELFDFIVREGIQREDWVWKVYELEDARRAHEDLEGRGTVGKLLLRV